MAGSSPGDHEEPRSKLDTSIAHWARVWNYLLGGKDNFAADRETGNLILKMFPSVVRFARLERRFTSRAVAHLAGEAGIRQFLDIGTGLPTAESTHEVAQAIAPQSRIVYVDDDPMVVSHAKALLVSAPGGATSCIEADVRDPDTIVAVAARTLDFSQPVALLMFGVMGLVPDSDNPHALLRRYLGTLPSGSCLALADGTDTSTLVNEAFAAFNQNSVSSYHLRSPEQVAAFFDGLDVVPPGLAPVSRWQSEGTASEDAGDVSLCGVAFKK